MPRSLVFRHDGVLLVATTNSREVGARPRIEPWDWKANKRQANVYPRDEDHPPSTYQSVLMAPSSDGQTIGILFYGLSSSGTLSIWDRDLKKRLGRMPVGDGSAAALSPDGSRAVIVSRENPRVQIWDTARSSLLLTLLDTDAHTGVTFTDAGQIVAGRLSGGITIWNPRLPASR
jgi:WD40 repeat protein